MTTPDVVGRLKWVNQRNRMSSMVTRDKGIAMALVKMAFLFCTACYDPSVIRNLKSSHI
jgi:hypothetical protein